MSSGKGPEAVVTAKIGATKTSLNLYQVDKLDSEGIKGRGTLVTKLIPRVKVSDTVSGFSFQISPSGSEISIHNAGLYRHYEVVVTRNDNGSVTIKRRGAPREFTPKDPYTHTTSINTSPTNPLQIEHNQASPALNPDTAYLLSIGAAALQVRVLRGEEGFSKRVTRKLRRKGLINS